jgi:hypothetical protein
MHFIENELMEGNKVYRSFTGRRSPVEGFLEDYAWLIRAFMKLYQADFNEHWLHRAAEVMNYTISHFYDEEDNMFFFTSRTADKLIARKKELFDNVIPSSNSVMAMNLYQLGILTDKPAWRELARKMTEKVAGLIQHEPNYMANWGIAWMETEHTMAEVGIIGPEAHTVAKKFSEYFLPFALFDASENASELPLLKGKSTINGRTGIYVCRDYTCQQPVTEINDAIRQLQPTT